MKLTFIYVELNSEIRDSYEIIYELNYENNEFFWVLDSAHVDKEIIWVSVFVVTVLEDRPLKT